MVDGRLHLGAADFSKVHYLISVAIKQETVIEPLIGLLIPSPPWTGRLVAASAKAVSIIHPDGALVSVVGRPQDMEARAMMPAEGFSGFSAMAERALEDSGMKTSGGFLDASWDGKQLRFVPLQAQEQSPMCVQPGKLMIDRRSDAVLDFGNQIAVWDPRGRLSGASMRFLANLTGIEASGSLFSAGGIPSGGALAVPVPAGVVLAAEVRATLAKAYAEGRRAEGLHGSGAFAEGFRRLEAHPDFPAVAVGFGPGTTPAGDDWLAGCLVALDLRAGGPGKAAVPLRQKIRDRLEQTTAAGRALLLGALAGAPPEYLVGLAEAAADWKPVVPGDMAAAERQTGKQALRLGRLRAAVSSCLAHGATSGEDALAGFVSRFETNME